MFSFNTAMFNTWYWFQIIKFTLSSNIVHATGTTGTISPIRLAWYMYPSGEVEQAVHWVSTLINQNYCKWQKRQPIKFPTWEAQKGTVLAHTHTSAESQIIKPNINATRVNLSLCSCCPGTYKGPKPRPGTQTEVTVLQLAALSVSSCVYFYSKRKLKITLHSRNLHSIFFYMTG